MKALLDFIDRRADFLFDRHDFRRAFTYHGWFWVLAPIISLCLIWACVLKWLLS